jgi:hypothetical protein
MRLGLTIGSDDDVNAAQQADKLGLWAVEVSGPPGTEMLRAACLAEATEYIRLVVRFDLGAEHPFTIAEELSVLDNLSGGRVVALATGVFDAERLDRLRDVLLGRAYNGAMLAPPPVQTVLPVWCSHRSGVERGGVVDAPNKIEIRAGCAAPGRQSLSGVLTRDTCVIDAWRDAGCTHLLVSTPSDVRVVARHLATRAATTNFPEVVAQLADHVAPFDKPTPIR